MYLDSVNLVSMILTDKGYYDYDYEEEEKLLLVSETKKSKKEINAILRNFGLPVEQVKDEELQQFIIKEETEHGS